MNFVAKVSPIDLTHEHSEVHASLFQICTVEKLLVLSLYAWPLITSFDMYCNMNTKKQMTVIIDDDGRTVASENRTPMITANRSTTADIPCTVPGHIPGRTRLVSSILKEISVGGRSLELRMDAESS